MTPAVGFLTRALRGVKGQAKKLSLFDPDPQLMTMATLTDNASLVVGDGDRIIAKNTQWLTDVPEATDEEGSNEADDASPITSPLDPAASLHQSVGSIAPGPGSQRGLGVGGVVGTTTLSGPSPLRGSGVLVRRECAKAAGITFKEEAWARIGNMFEINAIRREHWDYVADKSRECVSVLQCNKAPINAPHGHHQQYRLHLGKEMKGIASVTSYEDQGSEDAVMDVKDSASDGDSDGGSFTSGTSKSSAVYLAAGSVILSDSEDEENEERMSIDVDEAEGNNNSVVLEDVGGRKRKLKAPVWEFAKKVDGKAVCNACNAAFVCPNGNTSNITGHILGKHKSSEEARKLKASMEENAKVKSAKKDLDVKRAKESGHQLSINAFFPGSKQLPKKVKEEIDNNLVEFIICENSSFETVESHFFRKLLFSANNSYIIPSRRTITKKVDEKIIKVKQDLASEIREDISKHKTISITSDGGNSGDLNKTKKNTLTISRVNENFVLKTDIVAVPEAKGSQEAVKIRRQWKEELLKIGYDESWHVNVTTDGAANFRSARAKGRHEDVGLPTKYTTDCVDHQIHLAVEESIKNILNMAEALKKGKALVNHFSRANLSRQMLKSIQEELGTQKLCPIVGTSNRWFHKMSAVERLLEIRGAVELFQARASLEASGDDDDDPVDIIEDHEWSLMKDYVKAVKIFQTLSKFLGGQTYPAAGSVIPALDQIREDLEDMNKKQAEGTEGKLLIKNLLQSMQKRFPQCWRNKNPYNCLTYLDPKYIDMYADTNDLKSKVLSDIGDDEVFDSIRTNVDVMGQTAPTDDARDELFDEILVTSINPSGASCSTSPTTSRAGSTSSTTSRAEVPATTSAQSATAASGQSMPSRRLALLAKKRQQFRPSAPTIVTFQSRLTEEFERLFFFTIYLKCRNMLYLGILRCFLWSKSVTL